MAELFYTHAENTASRLVAGETVIVRLPEAEMIVLNETGSALWAAADGTRSASALGAWLQERYGLDTAPDVQSFLSELVGLSVLAVLNEPLSNALADTPAPDARTYALPAIRAQEKIETLAGLCDSSFDGPMTDCRTFFSCEDFEM